MSNKVTESRNDSKITSLASDRNQDQGIPFIFVILIIESKSGMVRHDKSSKRSLVLEEAQISYRDIKNEFQMKKPKKMKQSKLKKFKNTRRGKRKRAAQESQAENDKLDDMIFNDKSFDLKDHEDMELQNMQSHEIKAAQQMRRINAKHNLSKVEEEECDDTMIDSKAQNTLLTKNILPNNYKFGSAQFEDKSLNKSHILSKQSENMEIYFEEDDEI